MQISLFEKDDSKKLFEYLNRVSIQTNNLGLEQQELQSSFDLEKIKHLNDKLQASVAFVAQDDKAAKIIGLAQISRKLRIRYMNQAEFAISVDEECWGQHIGSKLIEACIAWATKKWDIDGIYLEVLSDNQRAINLYKKYGFEIVGNLPILLTIDGQNKAGKLMFKSLKK
ncbi:MAG: GNAT family N-acetyltransferase [Liquorilactobacillus sp.]|uniref:GNAT family N-acetyltransferase n=1 Tax=Liquorilactobacillus sp. TaxID=2767923 RepID=UPI0039EA5FF4